MSAAAMGSESAAFHGLVCLDGSRRASDAIAPAHALATHRGTVLEFVVLADDRRDVRPRVHQQLEATGLGGAPLRLVDTRAELVQFLMAASEEGVTPVISVFGRWGTPSRIFGVLGELVRRNVGQLLAVGPRVAPGFGPVAGPVVVAVDNVRPIEPLIVATSGLVGPRTSKVSVARVVAAPDRSLPLATSRDASKFQRALHVDVEAVAITGRSVGRAVADYARGERAAAIVVRSWHRSAEHHLSHASNSLSIVAHAPCPVLMVT